MGRSYHDVPYRIVTGLLDVKSVTENGKKIYYLKDISDKLAQNNKKVISIFHREPNNNAFTQDGKALIRAEIFHASHLYLKDSDDRLIWDGIPLSLIPFRSGGENNFWMFAEEGMENIDFDKKKSYIQINASDTNINSSATANEQVELMFVVADEKYC
ncbi:MAG: hypothetical protein AAFZ15_17310 [Bacteroidota bacterium]